MIARGAGGLALLFEGVRDMKVDVSSILLETPLNPKRMVYASLAGALVGRLRATASRRVANPPQDAILPHDCTYTSAQQRSRL
jgi:hypothetical protein